ncbi:very short patch repair endonuclease [Streptomyces sp. cg36]|uniref:very short patch repair endonuclease n=1 Tax=Streptomyces sp. cg36 TaxID=3238798 RepID=UPI0034E1FEE9
MVGGARAADRQWVATAQGEHLRDRRVTDTKPEVTLRKTVHRLGLRFRLQRRAAPRCTADFVLPRRHVAVFVDGCFWHGCPDHSPEELQGPNATLWREKIKANRERDKRNTAQAKAAGWIVVRVWECEIRRGVERVAQRVAEVTGAAEVEPHRRPTTPG